MPSFYFCRMLHTFWTIFDPLRSQSQGGYLSRMRSFRSSSTPKYYYSDSHLLPLHMNVSSLELETLRFNSKNSSSLSKPFIGYFQVGLALFQIMSSSPSGSSSSVDQTPILVRAAMVLAFAASLSGSFLSQSKTRLATVVERFGYFCFTLAFFLMTKDFLSGNLVMRIVGWLAGAIPMLAFLISCLA